MKSVALLKPESCDANYIDLAQQFDIPIIAPNQKDTFSYYLEYAEKGLQLCKTGRSEPQALFIDFLDPALQRRISRDKLKREELIKAVYPKGERLSLIWDLTAGLGRDAFLLSAFHAKVIMVERNAAIAALLSDALVRMNDYEHDLDLTLVHVEALNFIQQSSIRPDVIYLDPMHPKRRSAKVNQSMMTMQDLIGEDSDFLSLFDKCINIALKRTVIKWPVKYKSPLQVPDFSHKGRSIRYDVYLSK